LAFIPAYSAESFNLEVFSGFLNGSDPLAQTVFLVGFFFPFSLAFFDTTLPVLERVKSDFFNPPEVFSLVPRKTEDFARLPLAIFETFFALRLFIPVAAFFIADFMTFFIAAFLTSGDTEKSVVVFCGIGVEVKHEDDVDNENDPPEWPKDESKCSGPPVFSQVPDVVNVVLHGWVENFS